MALSGVHRVRWGGGAQEAARRTADGAVGAGAGAAATRSRSASAALVGTRAATAYGEHVAGEFAVGLVERDVAVVSGGAYGIDGAAHRGGAGRRRHHGRRAGRRHRRSVSGWAFGAAAPDRANGLLVTEYPPGVRPARHRFLTRNRLVAALGRATVVVEAGLRSGAANTAAWADAMGRAVCAVPGPVTSAASAGCHELLRRDGLLVTRPDEIVEIVGRSGELAEEPEHPASRLDGLPEAESGWCTRRCRRGGCAVEQIAVGSGLPAERVLGPLAMLEIAGLVEKIDGRWRLVRC